MAVVAKWMCDRDNTMFDTKKEAEAFGIFLAKNKEAVVQACKGKPMVLAQIGQDAETNVTPLKSDAATG